MIQLATDQTTNRMSYRPIPGKAEDKNRLFEPRHDRGGHPWPFLSRQLARPAHADSQKSAAGDCGS